MNICILSQNSHGGVHGTPLSRTFENARTEFAWQIALNAHHFSFNNWIISSTHEKYDLIIIILPKKLEIIPDLDFLLKSVKTFGNKITVMQEGPAWYYQDYSYEDQVTYINFLNEMDFLLVHNRSDIPYFKGIFKKPTFNLQSLMIEDTIKNIIPKNNDHSIIGGNFCSWYGGVDSYFVARNFGKDIYIPSMGRRIKNEEHFPNIKHLPYMMWTDWMNTLSQFNVGIHLMRTHAAGTFALNCAYFGIPCIGYKGLDTQEILHPHLSVNIGDIEHANQLAIKLRDDKDFYKTCCNIAKSNYNNFYTEEKWLTYWKNIINEIYR